MDKFIDKMSSYNLLNNLIPGGIFCYLLQYVCSLDILSDSAVENLFIYYFVGMVISRVGSIVIEPIAKTTRIISYADYDDYIAASKFDNKIDILLETSNLYLTIAAGGMLIIIVKLYMIAEQTVVVLSYIAPYIVSVAVILIFLLSFRKQTKYIKGRVNKAIRDKQQEEDE